MREGQLWAKINQILALQKNLEKFLLEQKYIVADTIIKIRFLESKLNIQEGEYEDFKKTFVAQLEEYKKNLESDILRSETTGTPLDDCEISECKLPGGKSN
jgi:hypothetical protein